MYCLQHLELKTKVISDAGIHRLLLPFKYLGSVRFLSKLTVLLILSFAKIVFQINAILMIILFIQKSWGKSPRFHKNATHVLKRTVLIIANNVS